MAAIASGWCLLRQPALPTGRASIMTHELVAAFATAELALNSKLCDMLNEQPQHRTDRRGCGLTQATRLLAEHINHARSATDTYDLSLFANFPQANIEVLIQRSLATGWTHGWRQLHQAPAALLAELGDLTCTSALLSLHERLDTIRAALQLEESRLVMQLLQGVLAAGSALQPQLAFMPHKPEIGSCSQAEEFFLEIAHGKIRRGGHVNLLLDAQGCCLLIEKMHLGESHSALLLAPLVLGGVALPPGSLLALDRPETQASTDKVNLLPVSTVREARFLRLTTLAVAPAIRERAFSSQFKRQLDGNMLSPASTTLDDLRNFARVHLSSA